MIDTFSPTAPAVTEQAVSNGEVPTYDDELDKDRLEKSGVPIAAETNVIPPNETIPHPVNIVTNTEVAATQTISDDASCLICCNMQYPCDPCPVFSAATTYCNVWSRGWTDVVHSCMKLWSICGGDCDCAACECGGCDCGACDACVCVCGGCSF